MNQEIYKYNLFDTNINSNKKIFIHNVKPQIRTLVEELRFFYSEILKVQLINSKFFKKKNAVVNIPNTANEDEVISILNSGGFFATKFIEKEKVLVVKGSSSLKKKDILDAAGDQKDNIQSIHVKTSYSGDLIGIVNMKEVAHVEIMKNKLKTNALWIVENYRTRDKMEGYKKEFIYILKRLKVIGTFLNVDVDNIIKPVEQSVTPSNEQKEHSVAPSVVSIERYPISSDPELDEEITGHLEENSSGSESIKEEPLKDKKFGGARKEKQIKAKRSPGKNEVANEQEQKNATPKQKKQKNKKSPNNNNNFINNNSSNINNNNNNNNNLHNYFHEIGSTNQIEPTTATSTNSRAIARGSPRGRSEGRPRGRSRGRPRGRALKIVETHG